MLISRQTGKSYTLALLSVETCLRKKDAVVKFVTPKLKMVKNILNKNMKVILQDCPPELMPEWKESEKVWRFPNGSEIQAAGSDNQNYDSIRGGTCLQKDTLIITTDGVKKIKDIKAGDIVYGYNHDGSISETKVLLNKYMGKQKVTEFFHKGIKLGAATDDHIFLINSRSSVNRKNPKNIEKRFADINTENSYFVRKFLKTGGVVNEPHAYAIGAFVGDGCKSRGNILRVSSKDDRIPNKIAETIGCLDKNFDFNIVNTWNRESCLKLLAGLYDTDGSLYVGKSHCDFEYTSCNLDLIKNINKLILKLFQISGHIKCDNRGKVPNYKLKISSNLHVKRIIDELKPYSALDYKVNIDKIYSQENKKNAISIKKGQSFIDDTYDIMVDNESNLYLTAYGVVTHNCDLWIVDEACFCNELEEVVYSVLIPTTTTTGGTGLLSSTPDPKNPEHPFIKMFVEPAEISGRLFKFTIDDNVRLSPDEINRIVTRYPNGRKNPRFRAEYLCVDENTPIKTINGYKKIKDIKKGDMVFTHKGQYKPVLNKFKNPLGNRNVYQIDSSNHLKHIVTEGHKIYVTSIMKHNKNDLSNTKWIKVEDFLNKKNTENIYFKIPIEKCIKDFSITEDLAFLSGWYVAKGHCSKHNQQVVFSLGNNDPIDEIKEKVNNVFGKSLKIVNKTNSCTQWSLNCKTAKNYFSNFGKTSKEKIISSQIKFAPDNIKKIFLDAYFNGNGCRLTNPDKISCNSVSFQLIADISDLLNSIGVGCLIQKLHNKTLHKIEERIVNFSDFWQLSFFGKNLQIYKNKKITSQSQDFVKNGYFYSRIRSVEKIDYNKKYVYDIEVQDDHSYVGLHSVFHNCEVVRDIDSMVFSEFDAEAQAEIITDQYKIPKFYDYYLSMDIGGKDFTVILIAYYDFINGQVVVIDEIVIKEKQNTKKISESIKKKLNEHFDEKRPYLMFADNNNIILLNDLQMEHGLNFIATRKDNKEAAINNVRLKIMNRDLVIDPRCKTLISHMKNATWEQTTSRKGYREFSRSADNGHYDACDALIYLIRNIVYGKNPYPSHYGALSGENNHVRYRPDTGKESMAKLFKPKKSIGN